MAGKAPSRGRRERGHTSRPYDRPNQSLLRRVASTVKGLFTPSTWFPIPNWSRDEEEEEEASNAFAPTTVEPDLTENEEETEDTTTIRPRLPNRSKRQKIDDNVPVSSTPITPSYWLEPSTSRDNLTEKVDLPDPSMLGGCQIGRKDTPIVNGDDQSENSDGSASTSGCSSLISSQDKPHHRSGGLKLSESALEHLRGELKNKPAFQRPKKDVSIATDSLLNNPGNTSLNEYSLWQYGSESIAKSSQRQSLIARTKPTFSASSFGSSSKETPPSKVSSPYYEGSTMYGGAASCRKRQLPSTSPYQFSSPKLMKNELLKVKSQGEEVECMSAAAKRILHTLEKMSTPVSDAKKIPNVGASPLDIPLTLTPPSQRFKSYLSVSRQSPIPSPNPPPIVNLNSISKRSLVKNHQARLSRKAATQIPLRVQPILQELLQDSQETPTVPPLVPSNRPNSSPGSSGGKMRVKRKNTFHTTAKSKEVEDDVREEYELPNIPLPVKTMPVISFDPKPTQSVMNYQEQKDSCNENELSFTFSNPIEYSAPAEILQPEKSLTSTFTFSSPIIVTSSSTSVSSLEKKSSETSRNGSCVTVTNGSVEAALRQMREAAAKFTKQDNVCSSFSASAEDKLDKSAKNTEIEKESTTGESSSFGDRFKPQEGSWSCSTCLVQNGESCKMCISCEAPKPVEKYSTESVPTSTAGSFINPSQSSGLFEKFQPKPGNWECSVCLVSNNEGDEKCVACETPNPESSQKKTSEDVSTSRSTGEKKDIIQKNTLFEFGKFTQSASETWECDTCLVHNSLDKTKCMACETLRPSKEKGVEGSSSMSVKSTSQSATGFKFGSLFSSTAATASSTTFKFGIPSDFQKPPASSTSQSIFGSTAVAAVSNISFKFGVPTEPTKSTEIVSSGEQKVSDTSASSTSKNTVTTLPSFKFGVSDVDSSNLSSSKGFMFGSTALKSSSDDKNTKPVEDSKSIQKEDPDCVIISSTAIETSSTAASTVSVASSAPEPIKTDLFMFGSSAATAKSSLPASGGFKFQPPASMATSSFGSSPFGDGIKVGDQQTQPSKVPSFTSEGSKSSPIVPVIAKPTTTESTVPPFHSKPSISEDSQKTVQAVSSGLPKPTQLNFNIPSSTADAETNRTSTAISSGWQLFGQTSQQQPSFGFKMGDSSSMTKNVSTVFGAPQANQANPVGVGSPFTFGASSNISAQSVGSKTEVKASVPNQGFCISSPLQTAASSSVSTSSVVQPFSFSSANASVAPVSNSSAFSVSVTTAASSSSTTVSTVATSNASTPKTSTVFKFGDTSSADVKTFNTGFSFKRTSDDKTTGFTPANNISFGAATPFKCESTSNPGLMTALPSTPFQFGATASAQSTGGFVFGSTTKSEPSQTATPQFSFGSGPTKSSAFGGFQPSQPAVTAASMPAFNACFGGGINTATTSAPMFNTPSGSSMFTFGAKSNQPSGSTSTNPTPLFGTSVQQQPLQQQPLFGGNTVNPPPFGAIPATNFGTATAAKPESTGGFSFGASAPQQQQQSSLFVFGASADKKPAGTPQGTGFSFGVPAAPDGAGFRPPGFSLNTPQSFNFGATSTASNQPFQFQGASNESGASPSTAARRMRKGIRRNPRNRPD